MLEMSMNRRLLPNQRLRDAVLHLPSAPTGPDADSTSLGGPRRKADLPLQPSTWSIRAALAALFSFELLFLLFLSAGRIKANSYLAWMPVDLTGLLFTLSVIAGAFIVLTKKVNRHGLVIAGAMAVFATWLFVSLLWTLGVVYAHQKVLGVVLACWACAGGAVIIAADRARVRRFLTLLVLLAVWFAIEGIFAYAKAEKRWFVEIGGTSYAGLGNTVGYGAVIVVATLISLRRLGAFKVVLAALLGVFVFIMLVAGSRHPVLGLALVLLLAATAGFRPTSGIGLQRYQIAALVLLILAVSAVVALILSESSTFTLGRFETLLFTEGGGRSTHERQVAMAKAAHFWASAPVLGHGVGSFPILENWVTDERRHPHNVILEILCELGLVGLILFGAFLLSALSCFKLQRLREDPLFRCVFLLAVFDLSHALVGPDLTEHRLLYAMLGLLALPEPQPMPGKLDFEGSDAAARENSARPTAAPPQQQLQSG